MCNHYFVANFVLGLAVE